MILHEGIEYSDFKPCMNIIVCECTQHAYDLYQELCTLGLYVLMSCVRMCYALGVMCSCDRHAGWHATHPYTYIHTCQTCQDVHIATAGGNLLPTHLRMYTDRSIIMLIDDSLHKLD